jgi:hypothetical protein
MVGQGEGVFLKVFQFCANATNPEELSVGYAVFAGRDV